MLHEGKDDIYISLLHPDQYKPQFLSKISKPERLSEAQVGLLIRNQARYKGTVKLYRVYMLDLRGVWMQKMPEEKEYVIPNSPASTASFEEVCGEACPSLSPSSETDEDDLFSTVKDRRQKRLRGSPKQAWASPFLEKPAADKPLKRSYSVNTIFLEAAGPVLRPFTAIGLCRSVNQSCSSLQISCRTASESGQQDKMSSSGSWTNTDSLSICGSALGRRLAAITPGMTPKHSHRPTERRSKAASAFHGHAAKEPLPLLVGSSTHLFPKKLMKVCSSAAPCPPRRFHTACSQTLSRPVVTAHLH
ncbi:hypothetical protein ACRRTK_012108 [Alexandromys fortis]